MQMDEVVGKYVLLRDKKREIDNLHKQKMAKINEVLFKLQNIMLDSLNDQGADSVATPAGTVYKKTTSRASVQNWEVALDYIKDNEMWHVLPRSVNSTAIKDFIEETSEEFPGVSLTITLDVGVRRK